MSKSRPVELAIFFRVDERTFDAAALRAEQMSEILGTRFTVAALARQALSRLLREPLPRQ